MIKFRAYRYKHKLELIELGRKLQAGEATEEDDLKWTAGMVTEWDFTDEDTGEAIPAGDYMSLSILQAAQLDIAWAQYANAQWAEVKKTRDANSSSL